MRHVVVTEKRMGSGLVVNSLRYYQTEVAQKAAARAFTRRCMTTTLITGTADFPFGLRAELVIDRN